MEELYSSFISLKQLFSLEVKFYYELDVEQNIQRLTRTLVKMTHLHQIIIQIDCYTVAPKAIIEHMISITQNLNQFKNLKFYLCKKILFDYKLLDLDNGRESIEINT